MATHWVDGLNGSDSNGGTSYGDAKQTISAGAALLDADSDATVQLNIVNSTTYSMDTVVNDVSFDGTLSQDFTITGCDSSGNPAFVSVIPNTTSACWFMVVNTCQTCTVQYFDVNFDDSKASTTTQTFWGYGSSGDQGDITLQYIRCRGTSDLTMPNGSRRIMGTTAFERSNVRTVRYCYMENCRSTLTLGSATNAQWHIHDNVFLFDSTGQISSGAITLPNYGAAGHDVRFYDNTIYFNHVLNGNMPSFWSFSGSGADVGRWDLYNNFSWCDQDPDGGSSTLTTSWIYQSGGTGVASSGTRGYNVWYSGPNLTDADISGTWVNGTIMAPDDTDNFTTDSVAYEQADTAVFYDPASTYAWEPAGIASGLSITIGKDLRPLVELTSGQSGTIPGALPAATVNPGLAITLNGSSIIEKNDKRQISLTYTEDSAQGGTAGTVVTFTIPSIFTVTRSKTASGSYSSGVWTVGAVSAGASVTLNLFLRVNDDPASETDYAVQADITSHWSGNQLAGDTSDDSVSVTMTGLVTEDDGGDVSNPDNPARVPLIDVLPYSEPRFELDVNQRIRTRRNRVEEVYSRADKEDIQFNEFRSAVVNLATNTTLTFSLGGIQRASHFMLEADNAVQVKINGGTFLPAAKVWAVVDGQIDSLVLKNASTTDASEIYIVAVD